MDYDGKGYKGTNDGVELTTEGVISYESIITDILDSSYTSNGEYTDKASFNVTLQKDYNAMINSVAKYGGFYMGRYESSLINGKTKVISGQLSMTAEDSTSYKWYGLYARQKNYAKENRLNSVESHMIWGSQWDAMLNWFVKQGISTYKDGEKRNQSPITGYLANRYEDKLKNIYDLYGCKCDWTAMRADGSSRMSRSGSGSSNWDLGQENNNSAYGAYSNMGSRPTLYIK